MRRVSINRWYFKETFKIGFRIQLCLLGVFKLKFSVGVDYSNGNGRQSLLDFLGGWIPLSDIFQMVFDVLVFGDMGF